MSAASEAQEPSLFSLFDSSRDAADESETFRRSSPGQPWKREGALVLVPAALSPGVGVQRCSREVGAPLQREAVMADRCRAWSEGGLAESLSLLLRWCPTSASSCS